MTIFYVAHPIGGRDLKKVYQWANEKIRSLKVTAVRTENEFMFPLDCRPEGMTDSQFVQRVNLAREFPLSSWIKADFKMMLGCDEVILLPGWLDSPGCRLEVLVAQQCGMPIWQYKEFDLGSSYLVSLDSSSGKMDF